MGLVGFATWRDPRLARRGHALLGWGAMRIHSCLLVGLCLGAVGCGGADVAEKPTPPDMSALIDAYRAPTGDLDAASLNDVVALITETVAAIDSADALVSLLDEILDGALEETGSGIAPVGKSIGMRQQAVSLEGDGFVEIRYICSGFGANAPIDEDENGSIRLTATFTEAGVDPVVWGNLAGCKETTGDGDLVIDGEANLHLGTLGDLELDQAEIASAPVLLELIANVQLGGEVLIDDRLDFRVCREAGDPGSANDTQCLGAGVELKVDLDDGSHLIFFIASSGDRNMGGIRARNVTWICSFTDNECSDGAGNTVGIPSFDF